MRHVLDLPHSVHPGTCYINGLNDILAWHGARYGYYLPAVVGGMAGFSFMTFKKADPPAMVYWGNSTKYLLAELADVIGYNLTVDEGHSWRSVLPTIMTAIDAGKPVIAGALDMFHLHYYADLYHTTHVPIHYVLIVGYDDDAECFFVHDCSFDRVQEVAFEDLHRALDVKVPGMSLKNTIRTVTLPEDPPEELDLAQRGLHHKVDRMLDPPVGIIGVPAMRRLARSIHTWECDRCFQHMAAYAGTCPPMIPDDMTECNGLRDAFAALLERLADEYAMDHWSIAAKSFRRSGALIVDLCVAALARDGRRCGELLSTIVDVETDGYRSILAA